MTLALSVNALFAAGCKECLCSPPDATKVANVSKRIGAFKKAIKHKPAKWVLVCLNFAFWRLSQCKSRNHKQTYRILSNLTTLLLDQSFGIVLVSLCSSFPEGYGRHAGLIKRLTLKRHGICSYGCYNHRIHRICRVGRLAIKPLAHARSQEKGICDARPKDVCACGRRR